MGIYRNIAGSNFIVDVPDEAGRLALVARDNLIVHQLDTDEIFVFNINTGEWELSAGPTTVIKLGLNANGLELTDGVLTLNLVTALESGALSASDFSKLVTLWNFYTSLGYKDPSFAVIQTDFGTYPTASGSSDILTLLSADTAKYYFTGTALTDTITLTINALLPSGGTTGQFLTKTSSSNFDAQWTTLDDIVVHRNFDITLTNTNIFQKKFTLPYTPAYPESSLFLPDGGIPQKYGVDYTIVGNEVSWNGLGLDGFLENGDNITFIYKNK